MRQLKELIYFYNNYYNSQIDVKKEYTNKCEIDIVKQKEFIDLIVRIPHHIRNIGTIRQHMYIIKNIVNHIITNKMNINCDYGISNKILEYIPFTCPTIHCMESSIHMKEKRIRLFIQKCHYDNLIPFNSEINELLSSKYVQHTHFGVFLYYLEKFLNYNTSPLFHSYEDYYEYILYWIDYSGEHSAHYYKMKNLHF